LCIVVWLLVLWFLLVFGVWVVVLDVVVYGDFDFVGCLFGNVSLLFVGCDGDLLFYLFDV